MSLLVKFGLYSYSQNLFEELDVEFRQEYHSNSQGAKVVYRTPRKVSILKQKSTSSKTTKMAIAAY